MPCPPYLEKDLIWHRIRSSFWDSVTTQLQTKQPLPLLSSLPFQKSQTCIFRLDPDLIRLQTGLSSRSAIAQLTQMLVIDSSSNDQ